MKYLSLLSLIFLLGCQDFNDGIIINKPYIPEHITFDLIYVYNPIIGDYMLSPTYKTVPEQFQFVIEKSIDNQNYTKTINVSEEIYKSYNTFDYFPRAEDINQ